ncbi:tyrosinase family protein [Kitasatospora sp. NPDC004240]
MAVQRRNILSDPAVRDAYTEGVLRLKREDSTRTTSDFGIGGTPSPVSTYDLFVIWHVMAMRTAVPPGGDPNLRNAAHRGPIFLPWHRVMLILLEVNLQRVLGDPGFGLPYWDWTADAAPGRPADSALWKPDCLGGSGQPVTDGPFRFDPADPAGFRVRIATDSALTLIRTNRGLNRALAANGTALPTPAQVTALFDTMADPDLATYDKAPWDRRSRGFRNRLEGFRPPGGLHNQVHGWVGRDMGVAASPNDPVFHLHHCNVDRLWEGWMARHGRSYLPGDDEPDLLLGHRLSDPIVSPIGPSATPASVLDASALYTYDAVP